MDIHILTNPGMIGNDIAAQRKTTCKTTNSHKLNLFNSSDRKRDSYFLDNYRYGYAKAKGPVFGVSVKLRINRGQNVVDEYRYRTPEMNRLER